MKSLIYLDEYKMYSISSQIFEGLTEYILKSKADDLEEKTEQQGSFASGRVMADILSTRHSQTERRFLHDYAYTIFEDKLIKENKVICINSANLSTSLEDIHESSFIKITGKAVFNDTKMVHELVASHKKTLRALNYITMGPELEKATAEVKENIKSVSDRNKRASAQAMLKKKVQKLKEPEGELSDEYVQNLEYIIRELYQNQLLLQIVLEDTPSISLFSASLNRQNLKEDLVTLLHKYGRQTEREFTMFGIITQSGKQTNSALNFIEEKMAGENAGMRVAIMNMINLMSGIDKTVTGRLDYEYIIDPIAIYYQL